MSQNGTMKFRGTTAKILDGGRRAPVLRGRTAAEGGQRRRRFSRGVPATQSGAATFRGLAVAVLLLLLALTTEGAGPVELVPQRITLPDAAGAPLFADLEGSGRCALLVIDPAARTLLNYSQHLDGFSRVPDQVIPLPPQTLWVASAMSTPIRVRNW